MLIGTRHTINDKLTAEPLRANFMISGEQIEQKPSVKYLGVHIDNKLKWKDQIKAVASKVTRAISMIRHAKKFLPKHTLKVLYQGLVEPHFRFCCSVWGTCGVTTRCTLEKLQNRAIRIITDACFAGGCSSCTKIELLARLMCVVFSYVVCIPGQERRRNS